jgi:hypothetical protein
VYGGHQNYWFWGPPPFQPKTLIVTDDTVRSLQRWCDDVQVIGHIGHPFSRRDEWFDLLQCTGFHQDMKAAWPKLRRWN